MKTIILAFQIVVVAIIFGVASCEQSFSQDTICIVEDFGEEYECPQSFEDN